jgi:hypothetical protein
MRESVRALLAGIIDYAGLFPPAKLELRQALENYATYHAGPDAWMLGRFVCPVGQVLQADAVLRERGVPPRFSVLARAEESYAALLGRLRQDAPGLTSHVLDTWEIRLPLADPAEECGSALREMLSDADEILRPLCATTIFFEAGIGSEAAISSFCRTLKEHNERTGNVRVGYKLRTGGLERLAFPTPEQVCEVLIACRDTGLPLKFTAGLHHSVRQFDPGVGTHAYGFFNVFGAALLADALALDRGTIRAILLEEDPTAFSFTDAEFAWRDRRIAADVVRTLRRDRVISFGSCSFSEPSEDLRALELLECPVER